PKASESLELITSRLKANQYFIAAVLPLSGHLAAFANDVLEGIQLAVEWSHEQPGTPSVGLIVKDHDADRQGFLDDLSTLLHDDRPLVVIGPMLSKNLPVMAEMAQKTRIPLITPAATLPNVRRLGSYLFSTSLTYAMQAERIATYATKQQDYRRFCILHPDTVYGRELARLFAQEVRRLDGEIIAIEAFKEGETDFGPQIQRLKAEDLKKYGLAVPVDIPRQPGKPLSRNEKRVLYTPGFDAIFIPSRSHEIGLLAAQLAFHDIKAPLLGTNGWNSQDFARTADRTVDGATFVDGFFVDSPNPAVQDFVQRYHKRFQSTPSLFTMQVYDAARVVIEGVRHGATSGEALHDFLMTQRNLPTLAGPASFGPDGTLHRPLFLLQVKQGKFVQLDCLLMNSLSQILHTISYMGLPLLFAMVLHEYAHGWMAEKCGDSTAKHEGRLTINPLAHIDPFGTIISPLICLILPGSFLLGWAKPVPIDPRNMHQPRRD
ncbi:MAG: penicillin-binding protein activator, partial [Nitrospirota bacterium]